MPKSTTFLHGTNRANNLTTIIKERNLVVGPEPNNYSFLKDRAGNLTRETATSHGLSKVSASDTGDTFALKMLPCGSSTCFCKIVLKTMSPPQKMKHPARSSNKQQAKLIEPGNQFSGSFNLQASSCFDEYLAEAVRFGVIFALT